MPASCTEISEGLANGTTVFEESGTRGVPRQFAPPSIGLGGQIPTSVWVPDSVEHETRTYANGSVLQIDYVSSDGHWASFGSGFIPRRPATPQNPPTLKKVTSEQQSRFDDAFNEMWKRLHENDGKNPCADLFGGLEKAEKALKDTKFSVGPLKNPDAGAETKGEKVIISPTRGFFDTSGTFSMYPEQQQS